MAQPKGTTPKGSPVKGAAATAPTPPPAAGLSDETKLARAVDLYQASKYAECVQELDALIGREPKKIESPDVLERARVYYAACLIANGSAGRAEDQLRAAIRANPMMSAPDSLEFPAPVIEAFLKVKRQLADEIDQADKIAKAKAEAEAAAAARRAAAEKLRVERLEELAQRETVVDKNDRWLAALPFGVGQFQNRDPVLGWIFLTSETLLAGTALTALVVELGLHAKSDDEPPPDPVDLNAKLSTAHQVVVLSSWAFVAVAAVGVFQAQAAYVPEFREERRRPLPKELRRPPAEPSKVSVTPIAAPAPGGGTLGVFGRF